VVYIVDTVLVDPGRADEYMRTVHSKGVPVMTGAGARFVSCWATTKDVGEPVSVQTVWASADHADWNEIRRNMVLNPSWYEYSNTISGFWLGGSRRFYYPTDTA
jgi:hypothetical protein